MQDYISISSYNEEDSLTHHGIKGMKWGRRKTRPKSSKSLKTKKNLNVKVDKEKVKKVAKATLKTAAKATAIIGGTALAGSFLGIYGPMAYSQIMNAIQQGREDYLKDKTLKDLGKGNLGDTVEDVGKLYDLYKKKNG